MNINFYIYNIKVNKKINKLNEMKKNNFFYFKDIPIKKYDILGMTNNKIIVIK